MEITKEALEFLVNLGMERKPLIESEHGTFSFNQLERIEKEVARSLVVNTLTGLVDYIKAGVDILPKDLLIQIKSPVEFELFGPLNEDRNRDNFITAKALVPNIPFERFIDTERFNIIMQSSFVENDHKDLLLRYTGMMQNENVTQVGDNGVSQACTIKTGVTSLEKAIVPNPVNLKPYRSFIEIDQVESKFIFRARNEHEIEVSLFEADGGAWKNEAIIRIKEYLEKELKGFKSVKIIA